MARGRFRGFRGERDTSKSLRINGQIRISPVRLIDDEDEQIGIIDLEEAGRRARDAGLDLVEVAPQAKPPVCRIMDYGKWKYQQKKKEQKAKSHAKQSELKEMRLRPKTDDHDLEIKTAKARDFLEDGDKVQFTMLFRGREMAHRDLAQRAMLDIADELSDVSKIEAAPRQMGRRMTMVLSPDRKSEKKKADKPSAPAARTPKPTKPAPEPAEASQEA